MSHLRTWLPVPLACLAVASVYVPAAWPVLLGATAAGAVLAIGAARRRRPSEAPTEDRSPAVNRLAVGLLALLAFMPLVRLPIAPGADQAMYSAIARAMRDGTPPLSAAWPGLETSIYPRGYPALLALLGTLVGPRFTSLAGAGIALTVFALALGAWLRALRLGPEATAMGVAVTLLCRVPQFFFSSGSNATTLGLGFGLLAGSHLMMAARQVGWEARDVVLALLFSLAGVATHPIGGLGALALAVVVAPLFVSWKRLLVAFPALVAVAGLSVLLALGGPELSAGERDWVLGWVRGVESVFRNAPRHPVGFFLAGWTLVGGTFAVTAVAGMAGGLLDPRVRRVTVGALVMASGFLVVEAVGPFLPLVGPIVYPSRLTPLLAIVLGLPGLAWLAGRPAPVRSGLLAVALLLGVGTNIRYFQVVQPMATRNDLAAIACLERAVPANAVIQGAYGDATQWIPALTGHPVTDPHVHISVRDEYESLRRDRPLVPEYRFRGEFLRYGDSLPAPAGGTELCRSGGARLLGPFRGALQGQ